MAYNLTNKNRARMIDGPFKTVSLLDDFLSDFAEITNFKIANSNWLLSPKIDIIETDTEYNVKAELPGVEQKNIELKINDNVLTIEAKKEKTNQNEDNYYMREIYYGSFSRSINLPTNINDENIDARLEKGILYIKIPKREESKTRKITIK